MPLNSFISLRSWPRAILHIDADAFFASCEQAIHPQYRGRPVVTGKERGIVAAASYEAKALGIKRGVPLWDVKKICPDAVILPSDYETYSLFSKRMFEVIRRFTPAVEEYSIDEAFAEITGFRRSMNSSYESIALKIKNAIESDLGLTVSVGLSLSKVLAKIGSKHKKPSGFTVIPGRKIEQFLCSLAVGDVWGIGPQTAAYCRANGIFTALDFARQTDTQVRRRFTKPHYEIWQELNGYAVYNIETADHTDYATISKTKTFTPPSRDREYVFSQLLKNLENACIKARRHSLAARGVIAFIKTQDFNGAALEAVISRPTAFPNDMVKILRTLFEKMFNPRCQYRATGIVLTKLIPDKEVQMSLFDSPVRIEKLERIYQALDNLSARMGKHTVHLGATLSANKIPQHLYTRGDIPWRKQNRLKGESARKHLPIPLLQIL
jgi:nucleotidyltransferase/DNA polymerase involved in DNA repair